VNHGNCDASDDASSLLKRCASSSFLSDPDVIDPTPHRPPSASPQLMLNGRRRATSATTPPPRPQSSAAAYRRRLLEDVPEHRSPAARDAAVVEATLAGAYPTSLLGAPGAAEGPGAPAAGQQLGSFLKRNMSAEKVKRTTLRYASPLHHVWHCMQRRGARQARRSTPP
jgi:hypothetical protein